ncbi:hypothetical protein SK803_04515 [Lentzea sp. BCCO 10_0856]|uniref:Uncharacterized protein n=1 Tax=Lentzea miocenica TaxID=3095431 RepID=A0ABU4SUB3_9PSEU|nr:hypothetical protein [Lentzea sp. BCCO 10_0856]MDX8029458.1 hypothetical protein [Lentzea sp. BCCO 10_0856]
MYPTVTVEHLSSVTTAIDDSDDMRIYQFDREVTSDWTWIATGCGWTSPGTRFEVQEEVLAA